jgi:hypothetical protein
MSSSYAENHDAGRPTSIVDGTHGLAGTVRVLTTLAEGDPPVVGRSHSRAAARRPRPTGSTTPSTTAGTFAHRSLVSA